jgi:hypothetical protein
MQPPQRGRGVGRFGRTGRAHLRKVLLGDCADHEEHLREYLRERPGELPAGRDSGDGDVGGGIVQQNRGGLR